jgi:hypothetical protein
MNDTSKDRGDKLERSFLKQNFGINVRRDLKGDPVPDEESQLIDQNLDHLHDQEHDRAGREQDQKTEE